MKPSRLLALPTFIVFILLACNPANPDTSQDFWQQTSGSFSGAVHSLVISGGHIFAGMNDGIYRANDDGGNWTQINTGLTNTTVHSLAVNPFGHIFAGTNLGIYRTTNDGGNWTQIDTGSIKRPVNSLFINSFGHIFATTNLGIYRTTDDGKNWTQINTGLTSLVVYALATVSGGYTFAGTDSGVFRSADNGGTWTQAGLRTYYRVYCFLISSRGIFAGTQFGVLHSTDNGGDWEATYMMVGSVTAIAINSIQHMFVATDGRGVHRTTDVGGTWNNVNTARWYYINTGLTNTTVYSLAINSSGYIFAGTDVGGVFRSVKSTTDVK